MSTRITQPNPPVQVFPPVIASMSFKQELILRPFEEKDIAWVTDIALTPGFDFFRLRPVERFPEKEVKDSAQALVHHCIDKSRINPKTGLPDEWKLAVIDAETGEGIGYGSLGPLLDSTGGDERDVGYFIHPKRQGNGLAKRIMSEMIQNFYRLTDTEPHLFVDDRLEFGGTTVHPNNTASIKTLKALGFDVTDRRKDSNVHGEIEPRLCCTLKRKNFVPYVPAVV
jgi:RimJ/RimL family protein N-acetyltransferase